MTRDPAKVRVAGGLPPMPVLEGSGLAPPTDVWMLDGQTHEHYHSDEGKAERLKAIEFVMEHKLCWPPRNHECCDPVRAYLVERGSRYTGVK